MTTHIAPAKVWRIGALAYTAAGLTALFCWLLGGDFAWSLKERAVLPVAQLLLKHFHASDTFTGVAIGSLPAALSMIICPIVSSWSDRHRGRLGRRIPFLLAMTPIAAVAMASLAFCPMLGRSLHAMLGAHSPGIATTSLFFFGLFWTLFEIANLPAYVIFNALINDVVPSEFIGRFYGLFRAVSLIAGILFNYWLLGKSDTCTANGTIETYFSWMFIGMGTIYGLGFILMSLKVKEGVYAPASDKATEESTGFINASRRYMKICFSNSYYRWLFIAFALGTVAPLPINTFSLFYAKSLDLGMDTYGKYIAITYVVSLSLSYFLGVLADRFHPLRMGILSLGLYAVVMFWGSMFATTPAMFALAFILHGVLSGCFFTSTASLGQRLFPRASYAQFASALTIVISIASITIPFAVGRLLDFSGHLYRLTFVSGGILAVLGLVTSFILHAKFMALGGPKNYQAPE